MDAGIIAAAPIPCARRAATSAVSVEAHPHAIEARTNISRPMPKARRAPMRSARAPANINSAPNISV
ncbi:hypothetical protein D3C78_1842530 [compost metagenome]